MPPSFGTVSAHDAFLRKHLLAYTDKLMNTNPTHLATSSHARAHAVALVTPWPPSMSLPTQSPERCRYPDKAESGGWPEVKQISSDSYPRKIVHGSGCGKEQLIIPKVHCPLFILKLQFWKYPAIHANYSCQTAPFQTRNI